MTATPNNGPITKRLPELDAEMAGKRHVLEERRRAFDQVLQSGEALERKLQALLGSASLIILLIGTFQLIILRQVAGPAFWGFLLVILALYVVMVILILRGLQPLTYLNPIPDNWQEIVDDYYYEGEDRVLDTLIYNNLYFTAINQERIGAKVWALRWSTRFFMAIVILIGASIPFSLSALPNSPNAFNQSTPLVQPSAASTAQITPGPTLIPTIQATASPTLTSLVPTPTTATIQH